MREADMLKQACRIYTESDVHRYLMANAHGRWDGAEKAQRHIALCAFYVAVHLGIEPNDVKVAGREFVAVRRATQDGLTDRLDETIGFPLAGQPDYEALAILFFEKFHALAMSTLMELRLLEYASLPPSERLDQVRAWAKG